MVRREMGRGEILGGPIIRSEIRLSDPETSSDFVEWKKRMKEGSAYDGKGGIEELLAFGILNWQRRQLEGEL